MWWEVGVRGKQGERSDKLGAGEDGRKVWWARGEVVSDYGLHS